MPCEGYGIRLNWVQYDPREATHHEGDPAYLSGQSRRSLTSLGVSLLPCLPSLELDATLTEIDDWYPGEFSELERGAFSVFSVGTSSPISGQAETPATVLTVCGAGGHVPLEESQHTSGISEANSISGHHLAGLGPTSRVTGQIEKGRCGTVVRSLEDLAEHLTPGPSSPVARGESRNHLPADLPVAHTLLSLGKDNEDFIQSASAQAVDRRPEHTPLRHIDILSMPTKQRRLIHHWITFTSRKIVLLDEPHNPCRTMMLPMALQGLGSNSEDSNADVAIFHALCAASAYNLYELGGQENEQDRVLALNHDQQAMYHLRHNLGRADERRDQSIAMAIMACITVEAVSGTTQRWRTHVSGGLVYLARLQSQGVDETILSAFRQHMVTLSVLCGVHVLDDLKSFLYDNGYLDRLELTFPYYGVSRSCLRAHDRINGFAASASTPQTRTTELDREIDAFELQLYLDFPALPTHDSHSPATRLHSTVVHHSATAFYYAVLVFFQRSIRQAPVTAVQDLVDLGVRELESIDRVGKGDLGCMMLWPAIVLGAECGSSVMQQRMRSWFQGQRRLGFRNVVVLEELVTTVWTTRADLGVNARDTDWRDIISQARFDVFRL